MLTRSFLVAASVVTLALLSVNPAQAAQMKLLDKAFAAELCQAWNKSKLPQKLGRSGSGWIDSADSQGKQVMVMSRRDCTGWTKVQLVIEADDKGLARCSSGGVYDGKQKMTWKFEPTTLHWADFSDGFGTFDMPKIMNGFVGPYGTAMNNLSHFGTFFAVVGRLALAKKVDWNCAGADAADVADEVKDIDRKDMNKIADK